MAIHIHWTYDGCDEQDEYRIAEYWRGRSLALEGKFAALETCRGSPAARWS